MRQPKVRYVARSNSTSRVGGCNFFHEFLFTYNRKWHAVATFAVVIRCPLFVFCVFVRRHKRQIPPLALSVLRWLWGHIIWKKENKPRIKFTHRLKFYIWSKIIKACLGSTLILSNTNFYTTLLNGSNVRLNWNIESDMNVNWIKFKNFLSLNWFKNKQHWI